MKKLWNGFECVEFEFKGQDAIVVFPNREISNGKLAIKTEYWGAFPDIQINLLKLGFTLGYVKNKTRFATKEDCDIKAEFVRHLAKEYGLCEKCVPIGMSCGGAHAMRFAGFYPELVSCMYLDAPVLNFCSYPGKIGDSGCERVWDNEFVNAYPGIQRYQLLGFTEHPINMTDTLIKNKIPVLLVYGAEDKTVIYEENGKLLEQAYEGNDLLTVIRVSCRGHHPHGKIGDNTEIIEYILKNS